MSGVLRPRPAAHQSPRRTVQRLLPCRQAGQGFESVERSRQLGDDVATGPEPASSLISPFGHPSATDSSSDSTERYRY